MPVILGFLIVAAATLFVIVLAAATGEPDSRSAFDKLPGEDTW